MLIRLCSVCLLAGILGACVSPASQEQVAVAAGAIAAKPLPAGLGVSRRIAYDGAGNFILPDGSVAPRDAAGGLTLPNGTHLSPDGAGLTLPNGARCVPDGAAGYLCP
jgi:hypothetical protein